MKRIRLALPINNKISIVGYIAAGSTQVDDSCGGRGNFSIGINMCHNIVAHLDKLQNKEIDHD